MRRCIFAALLGLLLAGCAPVGETPSGPPAETPSVSQAPDPAPSGPQVEVHWDSLSEREKPVSTAKRLSDGPLDDFTPGEYGGVIPYTGGEAKARQGLGAHGEIYYETYYRYGLCTTSGTILTDPVFDSVYRLSLYNEEQGKNEALPVWVITRSRPDGSGDYYTAAGLLSADGSWYTGTRFRADLTAVLGVCRASALMYEDADNAVLISLADGSELARYSPYDLLPSSEADAAGSLFADGLSWVMRSAENFLFYNPDMLGLSGETVWLDGATGQRLAQAPMEVPQYQYDGLRRFGDGWYEGDEGWPEFAHGGDLTLHYDDGRVEVIPLTGELGALTGVSADNLTFRRYGENDRSCSILTDHALNVLYSSQENEGSVELYEDMVTGRRYPCYSQVTDEVNYSVRYVLLDNQGQPLAVCDSYPQMYDGFVSFADGEFYRLADISEGTYREVFRLPRWAALDTEADA